MGETAVDVELSMVVEGVGPSRRTLTVTCANQPARVFDLIPGREDQVSLRLPVAPGRSVVTLSASGDPATVPGTDGKQMAALKVSTLTVTAPDSAVNAASLQEFAAASPPTGR